MVVGDITEGVDTVVIGGGPGGYVAAIRLSQLGRDVTLVEENKVGGVCLNDGCIPSKALIHVADTFHEVKNNNIGIDVGEINLDAERIQEWKEDVVNKLTSGVKLLEEKHGVNIIEGKAKFKGRDEIHVNTEKASKTLKFENCVLATGSSPINVPGIDFSNKGVVSSKEALKFEEIPQELLVVGGGYIGMELGTAYSKLGSNVTVVEAGERILPGIDREASKAVERNAEDLGISIVTGEKAVESYEEEGKPVLKTDSSEYRADKILVAVGRKPRVEEVRPGRAGVEIGENGFFKTDSSMKTSNSSVYAIGDSAGQPMLAHKASYEAKVAAESIASMESSADFQAMPYVVYTDPEIAVTGMTKEEAEETGLETVEGSFSFSANGRAMTMDYKEGFVRLLADKDDKVLLGALVCGPNASSLISELSLGIEMGALVEDVALTVPPHPSLSEAVMEAAENVLGRSIHKFEE